MIEWEAAKTIPATQYLCGYCGNKVATNMGMLGEEYVSPSELRQRHLVFCPLCGGPTFMLRDGQVPGVAFGNTVEHLPKAVYEEARRCCSASAYTAATLLCRKLLMNVAVMEGAREGMKFIQYVDWLADNGWLPPHGKPWVSRIKDVGNEAAHELDAKGSGDAETILTFVEMLLKWIYEFPVRSALHEEGV